jgi:hypothetical protein
LYCWGARIGDKGTSVPGLVISTEMSAVHRAHARRFALFVEKTGDFVEKGHRKASRVVMWKIANSWHTHCFKVP